MEKRLSNIIYRLRLEAGLSQQQVCQGLCSVAQFARIEQNMVPLEHFMLDRLLERLGKSAERLEYILPVEVYKIYELRCLIQQSICHNRLTKAEELLKEYERRKVAKKPLHLQFIEQERAQIAWMSGEHTETVLEHIQTAIRQSMPVEGAVRSKIALSADEMKLLLFRWEVSLGSRWERSGEEIGEMLSYIIQKGMVETEEVKVLPYLALLLGKRCDWKKEAEILEMFTRRSLSLLRSTGKLLYMPEILEQYADLLERRGRREELAEDLRRERKSLLEVEKEYGISFEKFRLFQHINRRFEIDYELIRRTRIAKGIPQEVLCEDICAQETLSRIESGRRKPRDKYVYELMKKMGRKASRINTIIMTEDYEVLELKRKYFLYLHRSEEEKAAEVLEKIEQKLDTSVPENEQFILGEQIKIQYGRKKISGREGLAALDKVLKMTVDWELCDEGKMYFTAEEHDILNEMGAILENQDRKKATKIFEMQIKSMENSRVKEIFHILEWESAMGNLGTNLEEQGQIEEAILISKNRIEVAMDAGKGNGIGRALITMASAMDQKNDAGCTVYYFLGLDLLKLYKMEKRYQLVREYLTSDEFNSRFC
ncbi:helix-turn-helix transcriptional regulator [Roseburia hominis]